MGIPIARDVMTESVLTVGADLPLADVLRLFVEEEIHGAPVVDDDLQILGVVTTSDLLRAQEDERDTVSVASDYFRDYLEFSGPDWTGDPSDFQDRLAQHTAAEAMTKDFVTVTPTTPVPEVARCLRTNRIHRVFVADAGRLCGVISALDLMPVIEEMGGPV